MKGGEGWASAVDGDGQVVGLGELVRGHLVRGPLGFGLLGGPDLPPDPVGDLDHDLGVVDQELLGVLPALAQLLPLVRVPGTRLLDDAEVHAEVHHRALTADAPPVHDVELGLAERRCALVLDHLDPRAVAAELVSILDRPDPADIEPDRGVELESPAAGGRLRAAEHHADLLAHLVGEQAHRLGLAENGGQLPPRLAHQPRLHSHGRHAHVPLQFRPRHERRHRVDHDHVHCAGAGQRLTDRQRLLAAVRLGEQQLLEVHPDNLM